MAFASGSGHQSQAHKPFGQPACGRRWARNSAAMRKALPLSLLQLGQQPAATNSTCAPNPTSERIAAADQARCRATTSSGGGMAEPDARYNAAAWACLILATLSQRLSRRADRTARSAAARYRSFEAETAASDGGTAPSRATWLTGADTPLARASQRRRSPIQMLSLDSRSRSESKTSRASLVRRTSRPSTRRTTIGRRQRGHRRPRPGAGSRSVAQYGQAAGPPGPGARRTGAVGMAAGSTGTTPAESDVAPSWAFGWSSAWVFWRPPPRRRERKPMLISLRCTWRS